MGVGLHFQVSSAIIQRFIIYVTSDMQNRINNFTVNDQHEPVSFEKALDLVQARRTVAFILN